MNEITMAFNRNRKKDDLPFYAKIKYVKIVIIQKGFLQEKERENESEKKSVPISR